MHPPDPSIITDGSTFINPLGLAFTLLMGVLILVLPRRYAMLPVLALTCYMTMGMRVMVGGMNFTMIRILLVFAWMRLVIRGEFRRINLNMLDKTIIAGQFSFMIAYTLLYGTSEAFKWTLGSVYNALGMYFFFRFLLRDKEDIVSTLKLFAYFIIPLAGAMLLEQATGRNPFALFGGVPESTLIRDGRLRCEGPFAHPILAGTFGATLMPLFIGLWQYLGKKRFIVVLAIAATIVITVTSASSGPLLTLLMGALALFLWPLRGKMRQVRWALVVVLTTLHLVMKAPVWYLLGRIDIVSGSTGYHRALLIDRAIANFGDWWLVGTKSTEAWSNVDDHLFDVTNSYILAGANGGIITMILFIAVIVLAFKAVGRTVRLSEGHQPEPDVRLYWAIGASLFAHAITFMSVSYFDQNFVNWYLILAIISTLCGSSLFMSRPEFLAQLAEPVAARGPIQPAPRPRMIRQNSTRTHVSHSKFTLKV
ncbi:MAG TPA: hypothetical protein VMH31_11720 [Methylomirabilota bacterium]|nr:hypothetical protein [Methylomirabilota bacterium]